MTGIRPAYLNALEAGTLRKRTAEAVEALSDCRLCPRQCGVDRLGDEKGFCQTGRSAMVSSFNAHFGEESPLVGTGGSGTIFFTHCNLLCNFCQNDDISHGGDGEAVTARHLAAMMLTLQKRGCHNINFVTPSHVVPQILEAIEVASENGLCVPLVFNTSAYDRVSTLKYLEGIVDIYMPDFKFWSAEVAETTCGARDYPETARGAIGEMHRQVGDLTVDPAGIAVRGLLVRHLVMPHGWAGTGDVMTHVAERISKETYVNIMPQYRPCGRAAEVEQLRRPITTEEFKTAIEVALKAGITRLDSRSRRFGSG
ncbi:MAG: radical SAM protein [Desulfobacterales bacterium]|nr:radical SAM protein [Desulfobacterales bacterium]